MVLLQIQAYTASLLRCKVLLGYLDGQCQVLTSTWVETPPTPLLPSIVILYLACMYF
jgi:hypothetical protein